MGGSNNSNCTENNNNSNCLEIKNIRNYVQKTFFDNRPTTKSSKNDTKIEKTITPYIFVSFDLTDSARLKKETSSWERIISDLIDSAIYVRSYLKFWKFNGDELLFYREVKSIYQIVKIINEVYNSMNQISDRLSLIKTNDNTGKKWDKVELKSTIWIAGIDYENNFKINLPYGSDFIGVDIDEGFRLTKLATRGKCLIDPKIALMLSGFTASTSKSHLTLELQKYFELLSSDTEDEVEVEEIGCVSKSRKTQDALNYNTPHTLFAKNFFMFFKFNLGIENEGNKLSPVDLETIDLKTLSSVKNCVDRMKLISYSKCKGVWNEKEYPIIWYSDNWARLDHEIAYDEKLDNDFINKERINRYYGTVDETGYGVLTYVLLENIYRNTSQFSNSLNRILRQSKLKLSTEPTLGRYSVQFSNTYYVLVCYLKETNSILMLLRSEERGHLANTWDFCCQKYLQGMEKTDGLQVFCRCIEKRYGIKVNLVKDNFDKSIMPFFLKPIYRKGYFNQGIVCFGEIDTSTYNNKDNIENDIITKIESVLKNDLSEEEYPLYSKAAFIHQNDIKVNKNNSSIRIRNRVIKQLSYDEELTDSKNKNKKINSRKDCYVSNTNDILNKAFEYFTQNRDKSTGNNK